ncbi:MAG: ABC-2 family transporter protein [Clostridia bacterium]|nr:ABC-2 family transporter protein [Clostridia bacterium]
MLRLYCRYFSIQLKSALEYKVSFLLTALGQFLVSFAGFLSVFFMFQQFHAVDGFTYQQVLLCFSVVLSAFSIAELFAAGFKGFSHVVSNGEFDRIMLRPAGTLFQTFASRIEFSSVGRLLQAAIILAYAVHTSGIRWTLREAFLLLFMILCGTFLFMGLYIIYAALCFYTIEGLEFMNIFTDGGREFGRYPASIYGSSILKFLTFVIPLACFQYYPLLILLGKSRRFLYAAAPVSCLVFFALCCLFWRVRVNRYTSAGS